MGQMRKKRYQIASIRISALCGALGLLAAAAVTTIVFGMLGEGFHQILVDPAFRFLILVGVIALFAATALFGSMAGSLIFRFGLRSFAPRIVGIVLAWVCLFISAISGAVANFSTKCRACSRKM